MKKKRRQNLEMQILAKKTSTCRARETVSLYVSFKKECHRWKKNLESFKAGNADGNKRVWQNKQVKLR